MKEKIIEYIETLESKANDSDRYFLERNEALLKIDKAIEYIKNNSYSKIEFNVLTRESHIECHFNNKADIRDLLQILGDKE